MGRKKKEAQLKTVVFSTDILKEEPPLSEYLNRKYKLVRTEKFDAYMKAMGLNIVTRKLGMKIVPTHMNLTFEKGKYTLTTSSLFLNLEVTFKFGEEFNYKTPDGRICKVTFEFDPPNRLVEYQRGKLLNIVVREFTTDFVIMSLKINSAECVMMYVSVDKVSGSFAPIHRSRGPSKKYSSLPFFRNKSKIADLSKITIVSDRAKEILESDHKIIGKPLPKTVIAEEEQRRKSAKCCKK